MIDANALVVEHTGHPWSNDAVEQEDQRDNRQCKAGASPGNFKNQHRAQQANDQIPLCRSGAGAKQQAIQVVVDIDEAGDAAGNQKPVIPADADAALVGRGRKHQESDRATKGDVHATEKPWIDRVYVQDHEMKDREQNAAPEEQLCFPVPQPADIAANFRLFLNLFGSARFAHAGIDCHGVVLP